MAVKEPESLGGASWKDQSAAAGTLDVPVRKATLSRLMRVVVIDDPSSSF